MSVLFFLLILAGVVWALLEARDAAQLAASLNQQLQDERVRAERAHSELLHRIAKLESPPPVTAATAAESVLTPKIEKELPEQAAAPDPLPASIPPPLPVAALKVEPVLDAPPPPLPKTEVPPSAPLPVAEPVKTTVAEASRWNWEQFLGVKFFAWVGGLLTFLTVAFFVKMSFERGWVSNELRIIMAYAFGLGALGGGMWLHRNERYRVLAQTLCATGALILYGGTYAVHAIYGFIGTGVAFALMAMITAGAFVLAVRLDAQVIAILGMVGGFLTPILCSTGRDQPLALFSYIALLNGGLAAVTSRKGWHYLIGLAALGTILMQVGWSIRFFGPEGYGLGLLTWGYTAVFAFFAVQFAIIHRWLSEPETVTQWTLVSALAVIGNAALSALSLVDHATIAERPLIGFSLVLLLFGLVVWMRWEKGLARFASGALVVVMLHLAMWLACASSDHAALLVPYVLLLNVAALWMDRIRPGTQLPLVAAIGTVVAQVVWGIRFLNDGPYTQGAATLAMMVVLLALPTLHLLLRQRGAAISTLVLIGGSMLLGFAMLAFREIAERPVLLYAFVFALNAMALRLVWMQPRLQLAHSLVAGASFVHLAAWTVAWMTPASLPVALGLFLVFGAGHTAYAMYWKRRHPEMGGEVLSLLPLMSIALMLLPVVKSHEVSLLIWPAFLMANLIVMAVGWLNGRLSVVLAGMALTFVGAYLWMERMPTLDTNLHRFLGVLGGLGLVFMTAASVLVRRVAKLGAGSDLPAIALPASAAVMPFALLALAITELPVPSPSMVFALALVLMMFLFGLTVWLREGIMALVAMLCALAVQVIWHAHHFTTAQAGVAGGWYVAFAFVALVFPLVFRERLQATPWPWIASAAAPLGAFALIRDTVVSTGGWTHMGLLPLAFAIPSLAALLVLVRQMPKEAATRTTALAWHGGVALFFITLLFPMEFSRQYLSMSWALEGAALIWLYHRVPHRGLVWVGLALLAVVFVRLGLNVQLIESYERGGRIFFNWHLGAYGLAIASLLAAAKWLLPPHDRLGNCNVRAVLCAFAGVLGFVWINIEITNAFTPLSEPTLLIDLANANVGRRMTYSIAWAAYALLMIIVGFKWSSRGARYAGIGLMVITIAKVFIRDLAGLDNLYRIGALGAVAVMALAASFVYQRFFDRPQISEDNGKDSTV